MHNLIQETFPITGPGFNRPGFHQPGEVHNFISQTPIFLNEQNLVMVTSDT